MGLFSKKKTIVVHDGKFHCDDIFSVATIELVFGNNFKVIRTRDEGLIASADFVADVGGIYDADKNRFDHHQKGGAGTHANGTPFASFGLVWRKYGEQLCGSKELADKIEEEFVSVIDADDNGIALFSPTGKLFPRSFQSFFYAYRPTWKEDYGMYDVNFLKMVEFAKNFLQREIIKTRDLLEGNKAVELAYQTATDKRFIILDKNYPYDDELSAHPETLFVVTARPNGSWGVNTVSSGENYYQKRKQLPQVWAGLRDDEMAKVSGVPDAIFCHNGLFLAVAKSKEGALALVKNALE